MNNEDNQFITLAQNIKSIAGNKQQVFHVAKVISISPLVFDIGKLQLDREDVLINTDLLKGTKRKAKIKATSVTGNILNSGTLNSFDMQDGEVENIEDAFKVGDEVLLVTNDQQLFVLLCIVR